jgi:hypothetical protein
MGTRRHWLEIRESYLVVQVSGWQISRKVPCLLWMARSGTSICDDVYCWDERWLSLFLWLVEWTALNFFFRSYSGRNCRFIWWRETSSEYHKTKW